MELTNDKIIAFILTIAATSILLTITQKTYTYEKETINQEIKYYIDKINNKIVLTGEFNTKKSCKIKLINKTDTLLDKKIELIQTFNVKINSKPNSEYRATITCCTIRNQCKTEKINIIY